MNNLPQSLNREELSLIQDADLPQSSWRRRLYDLPLHRKTNLIPWFSFGGLMLFMGAGGLMLQGILQHQLVAQTAGKLDVKSQVILLSETQPSSSSTALAATLAATISAVTEEQGYTAAYVIQVDGTISLSSSATKIAGAISSNVALPDQQILQQAINSPGTVVHQTVTIEGHPYALAAQTIDDSSGQPLGILVHGTSMKSINYILQSNLLAQSALSLVILIFMIYLSRILGQAIAEPIESLQR
ncbi:MAG: hypothetical protein HC930_00840 [Hydrococcus sp. SU_1_0]|nr:hypothetical protein [Hydrococcus sp. SU_1_0]